MTNLEKLAFFVLGVIVIFGTALCIASFIRDNRQSKQCLVHGMHSTSIQGRVLCIDSDRRLVVPE